MGGYPVHRKLMNINRSNYISAQIKEFKPNQVEHSRIEDKCKLRVVKETVWKEIRLWCGFTRHMLTLWSGSNDSRGCKGHFDSRQNSEMSLFLYGVLYLDV